MEYDVLELAPIVAQLVEKYKVKNKSEAGKDKTEQFMGAVTFCIEEVIQNNNAVEIAFENVTAARYYVDGLKLVTDKLKSTVALYNNEMMSFNSFGNDTLCATFTKELRAFFEKYDPIFSPQENVVELSYPVLYDLSEARGIDKVSEYLKALSMEQNFMRSLPEGYVEAALKNCGEDIVSTNKNILEPVIKDVAMHALCGKPITKPEITEADLRKVKLMAKQDGPRKCAENARLVIDLLTKKCFENGKAFGEYIEKPLENMIKTL